MFYRHYKNHKMKLNFLKYFQRSIKGTFQTSCYFSMSTDNCVLHNFSLFLFLLGDVTPLLRCQSGTAFLSDLFVVVRSAAYHQKECGSTAWWSIRSSAPLRLRCTMLTLVIWTSCRAPTSSSSSRTSQIFEQFINTSMTTEMVRVCVCFSGLVIQFFQHKLFRRPLLELNPALWVWKLIYHLYTLRQSWNSHFFMHSSCLGN